MTQVKLYDIVKETTDTIDKTDKLINPFKDSNISLEEYNPKRLEKLVVKANLNVDYNNAFLRKTLLSLEALKDTYNRLATTIEDDHVTEGYLKAELKGTNFIADRLGLQIVKASAPALEGYSDDILNFGIEFKGTDQVTEDDVTDISLEGWTDDFTAAAINLKESIGSVLAGGFNHVLGWINSTSKRLGSIFGSKKSIKKLIFETQQALYISASQLVLLSEDKYEPTTKWTVVGLIDSVPLNDRVRYRNNLLSKLPKLVEAIGRNIHVLGTARTVTEIEQAREKTIDRLYGSWEETYSLIDSTTSFAINMEEGIYLEKVNPESYGSVIIPSISSLLEVLKGLDVKNFDKKTKKLIKLIEDTNSAIQDQVKAIKLGKNDLDDEVKEAITEYSVFLLQNITTIWELLNTATIRNAHTLRILCETIIEETNHE